MSSVYSEQVLLCILQVDVFYDLLGAIVDAYLYFVFNKVVLELSGVICMSFASNEMLPFVNFFVT